MSYSRVVGAAASWAIGIAGVCGLGSQGIAGPRTDLPVPDPVPDPSPVNVILIIADDVGVDQVGIYEAAYKDTAPTHPTPCTPELDGLATRGIRFTNAWSNPVCTPTRTQILTGMPAGFSGMGQVTNPTVAERVGLDPGLCTLAKLAAADAAVGKWHLADESQGPAHPLEVGFDSFLGPMYNLSEFPQDGPSFVDWRRWNGLSCVPEPMTEYATARTTADAMAFVQSSPSEPWFLYVAYNAAHEPFHCPPPGECPGGCGTGPDWCADCVEGDDVSETRAMVQVLDHHLGQLFALVDSTDTAVIFVGDNGTPTNATVAPFVSTQAKGTVYQGGINVPLIIRAPNQQSPYTCNALVSTTDLFQTVQDLLLPSVPCQNPNADSYSLLPYVVEGATSGAARQFAYSESFSPTFRPQPDGSPPEGYLATRHQRAIRDDRHKLIETKTVLFDGTQQSDYEVYRLYDPLSTDPLPHDPASLDDPGSPDPLDSAFEIHDLLMETPPTEGIDAKNRLMLALDSYREFTIGRVVAALPCVVRSVEYGQFAPPPTGGMQPRTTSYLHDDAGRLGHELHPSGFRIHRTFLEFDLGGGPSTNPCVTGLPPGAIISRVRLEVPVMEGGVSPSPVVEAWPMTGSIPAGVSEWECQTLFESVDFAAGPFTALDEWEEGVDFCSPIVKSFDLTDAKTAIADSIDGSGLFPVALTVQTESGPTNVIDLFDAEAQPDLNEYRLRIYYAPNPFGRETEETVVSGRNRQGQAYPNPFNPATTIRYSVKVAERVALDVFDAAGRLVRRLVDERQEPRKEYRIEWDGRDNQGVELPSGVYYSRLRIGTTQETHEIVLVR